MAKLLVILIYALCLLVPQNVCLLDEVSQASTEARFREMSTRLEQLEQQMQSVKTQTCSCTNTSNQGPIAFYAYLRNTLDHLGAHQHIVFDGVLTNVGNAYSGTHGLFTAPVKGVYAFFVTITNIPQHSVSVQLQKNGVFLGRALAHGSSANPSLYVTSTLAATSQLNPGDQVWVQNEGAYSPVEELDGGWSFFTGHLVTAM